MNTRKPLPLYFRFSQQFICGCFKDIGGEEVAAANARLIATAPDLLWALNQAIAFLANPQAFDKDELGKQWMALKARAEQP
jgi:hypothetical protein